MDAEQQMGPSPARSSAGVVPLTASRSRVLEALQQSEGPAATATLAREAGLHENTVREHLEALVERGLAVRGRGVAEGRGRPPVTYAAAKRKEPDPRVREYAALASVLAGRIAQVSDDPRGDGLAAGEAWAIGLATEGVSPDTDARSRRGRLVRLFADLDFDPIADDDVTSIALRRCPLLDSATEHPDVVCAVHLGLARGFMERLGGDPGEVDLRPFAEPGACRLTITPCES